MFTMKQKSKRKNQSRSKPSRECERESESSSSSLDCKKKSSSSDCKPSCEPTCEPSCEPTCKSCADKCITFCDFRNMGNLMGQAQIVTSYQPPDDPIGNEGYLYENYYGPPMVLLDAAITQAFEESINGPKCVDYKPRFVNTKSHKFSKCKSLLHWNGIELKSFIGVFQGLPNAQWMIQFIDEKVTLPQANLYATAFGYTPSYFYGFPQPSSSDIVPNNPLPYQYQLTFNFAHFPLPLTTPLVYLQGSINGYIGASSNIPSQYFDESHFLTFAASDVNNAFGSNYAPGITIIWLVPTQSF